MSEGSLTPEQQEQIKSWLKEKWKGDSRCPVCLSNNWSIARDLVASPIIVGGGMQIGGPNYPQVMNVCTNCGHTVYFNAVVMGLISPSSGDDGEKEKAQVSGGENG